MQRKKPIREDPRDGVEEGGKFSNGEKDLGTLKELNKESYEVKASGTVMC